MSGLLSHGETFQTATGFTGTVAELIGTGGQGEVYRASLRGRDVALKWYFDVMATDWQRRALESLVNVGAPSDRFLWPEDIVTMPRRPGSFGYVMALRDERYTSMAAVMRRDVEPTFATVLTAGFELALNFWALHSQGLCYQDVSFGNVFLEATSGEVLICDNDNVTTEGQRSGVLGTPRFMAPEVVRGEAMPATQTDLYSLAVLLFYMLMVHHPLEGKREAQMAVLDAPAMEKLFGTEPLFIFDPDDDSNAPDPRLQPNPLAYWPLYPTTLRSMFTDAFTDGLHDPQARIRETTWRDALVAARDLIRHCPACGAENFWDDATGVTPPTACWSCQRDLGSPSRLVTGARRTVVLEPGTQLYRHHLEGTTRRTASLGDPVAFVEAHPQQEGVIGLRNESGKPWTATLPDGAKVEVPDGKRIMIRDGIRVSFGDREGRFVA